MTEAISEQSGAAAIADYLERPPQQRRSRERMRKVLQASEDLLVTHDLATITTTMIAAQAGVSVGWLYRFFPDKNALYETLLALSLNRLDSRLDETPIDFLSDEWHQGVDDFIDGVLDFVREDAAFRRLWFSPMLNHAMVDINRQHDTKMASYLAELAAPRWPDQAIRQDLPFAVMRMFMGIIDKGVELVFADHSTDGDALMIAQLRLAAQTYLQAAFDAAAAAQPRLH